MQTSAFFISILSGQHVGLGAIALVGKLITLDAEINSLFLRAKGQPGEAPQPGEASWGDLTDSFSAITIRYRDAWKRFELLDRSDRVHHGQVELKAAFAEAIDDLTELKAKVSEL